MLRLGGELAFPASGEGRLAESRSALRLNPPSFLRAQVEHDYPVGFDRNDNVVGPPEEDRAHLLGLQLETVAGLLDAFVAAFALAGCHLLAPRILVRSAELNRDLVREAAPALARRIAATPSHWFGRSGAAYYPARQESEVGGNQVVAIWCNGRRKALVRYKFYAKTEERVRVALANRRAALAANACPLLTEMAAHVGRFQAPSGRVLDLLVALAPLLAWPCRRHAASPVAAPGR
jgi:hypothetical protein